MNAETTGSFERTVTIGTVTIGLVTAVFLLTCRASRAADFIRGDVNGDGVVSFADAYAHALLRRDPHPCWESLDVDDDGEVTSTDETNLIRFAMGLGFIPPSPFPLPGPDPTPDSIECESYGGGAFVDDPVARIEVRETLVAGGLENIARLRFAVSNSRPLHGVFGKIVDPEGVLEFRPGSTREYRDSVTEMSGLMTTVGTNAVEDGLIFVVTVEGNDRVFPPSGDLNLLEVALCVRADTPAGEYPIALEMAEFSDAETGDAIQPQIVDGSLIVLEDIDGSLAGEDCVGTRGQHGSFRLGEAVGRAGESVTVPVHVSTDVGAQGVEMALAFDADVLRLSRVRSVWRRPDRRSFDITLFDVYNEDAVIERVDTETGLIQEVGTQQAGALGGFFMIANPWSDDTLLPADEEIEFLELEFDIDPLASPGSTEIRFEDEVWVLLRESASTVCSRDGKSCHGFDSYENSLEKRHLSIRAESGALTLVDGVVTIVEDEPFLRGDVNADGKLDVTDPIANLAFQFLGSFVPPCVDACDFNDDGQTDVTDPVANLTHQFLGDPPPAPPGKHACGQDPTVDALRCASFPPCAD